MAEQYLSHKCTIINIYKRHVDTVLETLNSYYLLSVHILMYILLGQFSDLDSTPSLSLYACWAAALAANRSCFSCSAFSLISFSLWMSCLFSDSQACTRLLYCSKSGFSTATRFCWARAVTKAWKEAESTLP